METSLEILKLLCDKGGQVFDGNKRLNHLYEATALGLSDWILFFDEMRWAESFPPVMSLGWLQNAESSLFVSGPSIGKESIFTPAIRNDCNSSRNFMEKVLSVMTGHGCRDILPIYESLACAVGETVDMRSTEASVAVILGLTYHAGEAIDALMSPGSLSEEIKFCRCDINKIQKTQMSNFHIGLRTSTRVLRDITLGDKGFDSGYWTKTAQKL